MTGTYLKDCQCSHPAEDHRLVIRVAGGWFPADTLPPHVLNVAHSEGQLRKLCFTCRDKCPL